MVSDAVSKLSQNVVRVDVKIDNEWGNGTGLLLDNIGTVLTCDHVVRPNNKNPEKIQITKDDALPKNAEIVRYDQLLDVALIQAIDFSLVLIMAIVGGPVFTRTGNIIGVVTMKYIHSFKKLMKYNK